MVHTSDKERFRAQLEWDLSWCRMLDELLGNAKRADFVVNELICDKDTSTNATYCRHFPEGMVTYCSNHSAKNLHRALEKIRKYKCEASIYQVAKIRNKQKIQ